MSRCLLSYGADVLKVNGSGKTPLDICRGSEVEQLIRKIAAGGGYSNAFVYFLNNCVPRFQNIYIPMTFLSWPRLRTFSA